MNLLTPEVLFHGGLFACAAVVILAAFSAVFLYVSKKRLNKRLDAEFGKVS